MSYDPGYAQGTLNIAAYRIVDTIKSHYTDMGFFVDSLNNYSIPHTFNLKMNSNMGFGFSNNFCSYQFESYYPSTYGSGFITISKLDTQQGIISGTFAGELYISGCDTVNITEGRFDMKLH